MLTTLPNIVYMKRFANGLTGKVMVTMEEYITAYEIWSSPSHASYTLDR